MSISKFNTHPPSGGYTVIWNHAALNASLSAKAKGILWYLLTRPEDWDVYEKDIISNMKDGAKAVRSGIKELIKAGYVVRKRLFKDNGQFNGWQYDVFHFPVWRSALDEQIPEENVGKQDTDRSARQG